MKLLLALPALALSMGAVACGGTSKGTGPASQTSSTATATGSVSARTPASATSSQHHIFADYDEDDYSNNNHFGDGDNDESLGPKDRDNDSDNKTNSYYDADDSVRVFGQAANGADRQAITAVVKRYYAAAAAADGAKGCSLIYSTIARGVPENQGRPPGPPYLRGKTCAVVMSKLFKRNQQQLQAYAATLQVTAVRLHRNGGFAVLGFRGLPGRQIAVEREGGRWKIDALLDSELP